ncbi:uncharacterized protein [Ptychodera flava]|uniref:uncharacterized protein n=1 Tax=Ptychodera flava TaxID=63121 RepID=UPI00396AA46B
MSARGRMFQRGKELSLDYRKLVLQSLLDVGANDETGVIPHGKIAEVARNTKVHHVTVKKLWKQYREQGHLQRKPCSGGRQRKLNNHDLLYVEMLKSERPSISYAEIKTNLAQNADIEISTSALCKYVKYRLPSGEWTRKKITKHAYERFTEGNMVYTQAYTDFLSQCNPYTVKFMDESGIQLPSVGSQNYGHSPVGERCVELQRYAKSPNMTLNVLMGANGICYANIIAGASNTTQFLQFFTEAVDANTDNGEPAIRPGDVIVVDNCPIYHHEGGRALRQSLDNLGVEYVFTPTYSPDINPVEYLFNDLKKRLKCPEYRDMLHRNMQYAIFHALSGITAADCHGYFSTVGFLQV